MKVDVKLLENKNNNFENMLVEFDEEIDSLYEELDKHIINYNVELVKEVERESSNGNYSFYSLTVATNEIQDEIAEIHKEKELYRQEIFSNQNKLMDLENLKETIEVDGGSYNR